MGRWYDANLIRFFEGQIRPMKGWATGMTGTLSGNPRAAHAWYRNTGTSFAAYATHTKLYAHDGTTLDDITHASFTPGSADTSTWSLDNFGELLIATNSEEKIMYEWQPGGGGDATIITNAPSALASFVTDERIIVAIGSDGNPRNVAWCDQDARTTWTSTATNQAGDLNLTTKGVGMCGGRVRGGGLIWTTDDLHLMRYIGFPDIYGIERVGNDCGIISRHAFSILDSKAFWMGLNSFYVWAGYVETLPCDVGDDVFTNINQTHRGKVWTLHNPQFGEVFWFYPRGAATECSHYVSFNYRENHWNHGTLARNAGFSQGVWSYPVMVNAAGAMLWHEYGWSYDSANRYAISGPVELGDGEQRLQIDEIIPDEVTQGDCEAYFYTRAYPNATEATLGPYNAADRVGVITTARQARVEIRSESATNDFRIGNWRVKVKQRGRY